MTDKKPPACIRFTPEEVGDLICSKVHQKYDLSGHGWRVEATREKDGHYTVKIEKKP